MILESDLEGMREGHGVATGLTAPVGHLASLIHVEMNVPCLATGYKFRRVLGEDALPVAKI